MVKYEIFFFESDRRGGPNCQFKCINVNALKSINLDKIKSEGYSFQIEINFILWMNKFTIKEIPIIFTDRTIGKSKMSKKIIDELHYDSIYHEHLFYYSIKSLSYLLKLYKYFCFLNDKFFPRFILISCFTLKNKKFNPTKEIIKENENLIIDNN